MFFESAFPRSTDEGLSIYEFTQIADIRYDDFLYDDVKLKCMVLTVRVKHKSNFINDFQYSTRELISLC